MVEAREHQKGAVPLRAREGEIVRAKWQGQFIFREKGFIGDPRTDTLPSEPSKPHSCRRHLIKRTPRSWDVSRATEILKVISSFAPTRRRFTWASSLATAKSSSVSSTRMRHRTCRTATETRAATWRCATRRPPVSRRSSERATNRISTCTTTTVSRLDPCFEIECGTVRRVQMLHACVLLLI